MTEDKFKIYIIILMVFVASMAAILAWNTDTQTARIVSECRVK